MPKKNTKKIIEKNTDPESLSNTPSLLRLHQLILKMNPAQKKEFKKTIYAAPNDAPEAKAKYVLLFESIDDFISEHVNEENLFRVVNQNAQFGSRKKLTDLSKYLYDKILESLRSTPIEREMYYRLNEMIQDICTLFYMGLQEECHQMVQQAKKTALRLEKYHYLQEIVEWEMKLLAQKATEPDADNQINQLKNHYHIYQEKAKNIITAYLQTLILRHKKAKFNIEKWQDTSLDLAHLQAYFADENLQDKGFREQQHFYRSRQFFADLMLHIEPEHHQYWLNESFKSLEMGLNAYENPELQFLKIEEPSTYGITLEGFLSACLQQEKFDIFDAKCVELEQNTFNVIFLNKSVWYLRINSFLARNQFTEAKIYIEEHRIIEKIKKWGKEMQPSRLLVLRYQCALVYFLHQDWETTRLALADTLSWHRPDDHQMVVILSDLLDMLSMYELKIYGKSPIRLFENFEKRQRRSKLWNEFLRDLVHVIRQVMVPDNFVMKSSKYDWVHQQIISQKKHSPFGAILAWVDTKLEGLPLQDALKRYNW